MIQPGQNMSLYPLRFHRDVDLGGFAERVLKVASELRLVVGLCITLLKGAPVTSQELER